VYVFDGFALVFVGFKSSRRRNGFRNSHWAGAYQRWLRIFCDRFCGACLTC
jgi:hypothetical protein